MPCLDCTSVALIKNKDNVVFDISKSNSNNRFEIKTAELQVLALKNKCNFLRFYYKKDENSLELFLFEIGIF